MDWYFIAPDKPSRVSTDFLPHVNDEWIAEVKSDGFRCEIGNFNGEIHALSRKNEPLKISAEMIALVRPFLPEGCAFDAEFLNPIRVKAINSQFGLKIPLMEKLMIFDVTWFEGAWIGKRPLCERRALPIFQALPQGVLSDLMDPSSKIFRAPYVPGSQARALFEEQKQYLISEGIVVKKLRSKCLGSRTDSRETTDWYKIKHRD